jgi:hypothetical protein
MMCLSQARTLISNVKCRDWFLHLRQVVIVRFVDIVLFKPSIQNIDRNIGQIETSFILYSSYSRNILILHL